MGGAVLGRRAVLVGLLGTAACRYVFDRPPARRAGGDRGPSAGFERRTMQVRGQQRVFHVHVPKQHQAGGAALQLLLVTHGRGGSGDGQLEKPGVQALRDRGLVVVCPSGIDAAWSSADLPFLEAIIDTLIAELGLRPKTYIIGFSNGAGIALQLAALSQRIRAVATMGITLPRKMVEAAPDARLPFTVQIIGEKDPHFRGADDMYEWDEARAVVARIAGAVGEPAKPEVLNGRTTDAEIWRWQSGYVWVRVTGARATHRIYSTEEGDAIDGIGFCAQQFSQYAGLDLLPESGRG